MEILDPKNLPLRLYVHASTAYRHTDLPNAVDVAFDYVRSSRMMVGEGFLRDSFTGLFDPHAIDLHLKMMTNRSHLTRTDVEYLFFRGMPGFTQRHFDAAAADAATTDLPETPPRRQRSRSRSPPRQSNSNGTSADAVKCICCTVAVAEFPTPCCKQTCFCGKCFIRAVCVHQDHACPLCNAKLGGPDDNDAAVANATSSPPASEHAEPPPSSGPSTRRRTRRRTRQGYQSDGFVVSDSE